MPESQTTDPAAAVEATISRQSCRRRRAYDPLEDWRDWLGLRTLDWPRKLGGGGGSAGFEAQIGVFFESVKTTLPLFRMDRR